MSVTDQTALQQPFVSFFVDAVKLVGLPPSLGEIYGLLYITREPLALDDLVERLDISKGSASQGLKMLRQIGALEEVTYEGNRKTYYQAESQLKKLVGGFIREEIRPHIESGQTKLERLESSVAQLEDAELRAFYDERTKKLGRWMTQAKRLLPLLQKVLGE